MPGEWGDDRTVGLRNEILDASWGRLKWGDVCSEIEKW
jgi:hypothetical protein